VLVGAGEVLGNWEPEGRGIVLKTTPEEYPLWRTEPLECQVGPGSQPLEYKYVRLTAESGAQWEADGTNRSLPKRMEQEARGQTMVVDDGAFALVRPTTFAFPQDAEPAAACYFEGTPGGPRLLILGDAVALGHGAWCFSGWAAQLCASLNKQCGYSCKSLAKEGLDVHRVLLDFDGILTGTAAGPQPSVVLLAFSSGLSWLAGGKDWDREPGSKAWLQAIEGLVAKIWQLGAMPVVAGLSPHDGLEAEEAAFLRLTNDTLRQMGVPVLDWLPTISSSQEPGRWDDGLSHGASLPNQEGHRRMFSALSLPGPFEPSAVQAQLAKRTKELTESLLCFEDGAGFEVRYDCSRQELTAINRTSNPYGLNAGWHGVQEAFAAKRRASPWALERGVYLSLPSQEGDPTSSLGLDASGRLCIAAEVAVPAGARVVLQSSKKLLSSPVLQKVYYDSKIGVFLCRNTGALVVVNEADTDYNVHPMWNDVRVAMRAVPEGIYEDDSGKPFRTAVVSIHGLQSRIKVPSSSAIRLRRVGDLSSIERVALLPLGDRCSIRMLLHKIEFDGPCYPFDLTRTTTLSDVADIVSCGFQEMWYEELLWYDIELGRVFHKKWGGLSFAHEIEDDEHPVTNMQPIAARMAKRYTGRSARFDYACEHSDRVLFVRTGDSSRGEVENLMSRLHVRYPRMKAGLLLISDQETSEFSNMVGVTHVRESFDPDRMYEDMSYWMNSAYRFKGILENQGITEKNLYWCPNNLKEAEKERAQATEKSEKKVPTPPLQAQAAPTPDADGVPGLGRREDKFSHSNLFDLHKTFPPRAAPATEACSKGSPGCTAV